MVKVGEEFKREAEEKAKITNELIKEVRVEEEVKGIIEEESKEDKKKENPFKKLHLCTEHLPKYHEFSSLIGLYGRHYIPLLKARWYQLHGGILQERIKYGNLITDTRIHVAYPMITEAGKNDVIYAIKSLTRKGIMKGDGSLFRLAEPVSFHQEALIGKSVERLIPNPMGDKPKQIKTRVENRGHLNDDFVEFDECNQLITSNSPDFQQAREYLSKAENPIGRNEVEKRSVDDLRDETIKYCPLSTHSYYFQPFKKLPEGFVLQGFGRRKFIPVGNIAKFMSVANEELYSNKLELKSFSQEEYEINLIKHLELMRKIMKGRTFIFTDEAIELIKSYALYITGQAQLHSEKIYNFMKLSKFTCLSNLIKMSCIISASYYQNQVNENCVSLAFMDLVELMQSTFDFIEERIQGNFDYGTIWKTEDYKEIEVLKYLYNRVALSYQSSEITIEEFLTEAIMPVFKVRETQARNRYREIKKAGLIDSKQHGQDSSRVWLNFTPNMQKNIVEGDKGYKGYNVYNSVFLGIKGILTPMQSLTPLTPLAEFDNGKIK